MIHPTAIVSPKADLHPTVQVGPYTIIDDNVIVGEGCVIGSHVQIASGARLGKGVRVFQGAVIASIPQDLKFAGEESIAVVGNGTILREYVTINRGTSESGSTDVGAGCLLMAYAHVAHDCKVADHVIMANAVNLGGHVHIGEQAIVGGVVAVHQFVHIGAHSLIGGGFRAVQDVCPYALAGGYPLRVVGLNLVGLRRRGFPGETIKVLRQTFRLLFFSDLNTRQAVERIKAEVEPIAEVQKIITFIEGSGRGLVK